METREHQILNRAAWQDWSKEYVEHAEKGWSKNEPRWGIWQLPEADLRLLPVDLSGKDCIEIGCGTGYVSSWMARRGGRVVGVDPTPNQLMTARRLDAQYGLGIRWVESFGESLPFEDSSFDFAISEYGASLWADPELWIPEAARVLRPGSELIFLTNHPLAICCTPDEENEDLPISDRLLRPYLGLSKIQWEHSSNEVEFHLTHGAWISLLRDNGFVIERLQELGSSDPKVQSRYAWADPSWAASWPTEEVWSVRLSF